MEETHSQASQDLFVLLCTKSKRSGTFLEIGSNHPITHNNSYLLESKYDWRGILIEYDGSFEDSYTTMRPKSIFQINDARKVDYDGLLKSNNFPEEIDYLQIDLDVENRSTLDTLELLDATILSKYKFATVTFEHDIYLGDNFDTQKKSREIFAKNGYILLFSNVSVYWAGGYKPFEDWYVHPDLVDDNLINRIRKINKCDNLKHSEVIELLK